MQRRSHIYFVYVDILHIERLLYSQTCLFSVLELDARYDLRVMAPNTHLTSVCPISRCAYLNAYMHISTHKRLYIAWELQVIWTLSVSNDCSTIGDTPWVVKSSMRDPTGRLRPRTCIGHSLIQTCLLIYTPSPYVYTHRYFFFLKRGPAPIVQNKTIQQPKVK